MGWQPVGQPSCASCKYYLLHKKDNRFVTTNNKSVRGELSETHLCEKMFPRIITPNLHRKYGMMIDLVPCELYEFYRP